MLKRIVARRPSPALIVSFLALAVATSGFAMAAIPDSTGVFHACYKKKKGTLRLVSSSRKCRKSERAVSWNQKGLTGTAGAKGAKGDTGAAGSALGYAHVNADGTVDEANSKNITSANVTRVSTSAYCFRGLPFTPHSVVSTPDYNDFDHGADLRMFTENALGPSFDCAPGDQAEVATGDNGTGSGAFDPEAFFVVFN
jgi:hypothetical protein